ncbi:CsoR family transcriptional regulator [Paenibacillus sp. PK3_47]|uniref:metal-sensing transcriptional repressor n=1 Tax=Paenibacillus sp. PK3_47 TaxID=2072642 RepID=UPI00201E52FA|nr:metal-sensing transcriptional repressor [Paenibacillus sp. PK3_47]UQZ33452.1 CsoR family transcriptional regulator [Paenibacillus sp. PK3_47]
MSTLEVTVTEDCYLSDDGCKSHHSHPVKSDLAVRLNRIEGQVRGVKEFINKDIYCDQVLNQIAAIQASLNGVRKVLLTGHLKECVVERIQ